MNSETKSIYKKVSTATIATALYKRGLKNQFIQNVFPIHENGENLVGEAFTLRYIPAREDLNPIAVFRDPKHPQRVAVETCPEGGVLVIDSRKDASAASAGDLLITRLKIRGAAGVVSDGGFRDSQAIKDLGFPVYHQRPSAPTNLTKHQALDINVPIGCGDVAVWPGDTVVGDRDGVIVIPKDISDEISEEAKNMTIYETFVQKEILSGAEIIGLYPLITEENKTKFEEFKKSFKF
ncbi:ribonuclease activity regulator RraA [Flavobacteriaceae bacterium]|nr:ribonuclease activity regulator RraA [Flavobacteriaceae bacterium]